MTEAVFTWTAANIYMYMHITTTFMSCFLSWLPDRDMLDDTVHVHEKYGAFQSERILLFQRVRCRKGVHCHYCVVHGETRTLYTSLFWLLLIRINSAVKWQDLIYSNKRSMQQKGDSNHIIVLSKTSYFKCSYCEEMFVIFCIMYFHKFKTISFVCDHTQHFCSVS